MVWYSCPGEYLLVVVGDSWWYSAWTGSADQTASQQWHFRLFVTGRHNVSACARCGIVRAHKRCVCAHTATTMPTVYLCLCLLAADSAEEGAPRQWREHASPSTGCRIDAVRLGATGTAWTANGTTFSLFGNRSEPLSRHIDRDTLYWSHSELD